MAKEQYPNVMTRLRVSPHQHRLAARPITQPHHILPMKITPFCHKCGHDLRRLKAPANCPKCGASLSGPYQFQSLPNSVANEYAKGVAMVDIAKRHRCSGQNVRQKLLSLGATIRKAGNNAGGKRGGGRGQAKRDAEIIRLHVAGVVHPRIAKRFGLTRERVRQIVAMHQQTPRRAMQRRRRAEDAVRRATEGRERQRKRQARLKALSLAWKRGDSIAEIAAAFGMRTPNAANSLISYRRKRHPALFPRRRP
jgi:AraC-like DNA-binding protein